MANIVLSSSPSCSPLAITPSHAGAAALSSSPGLPSPSLLFSSMGPTLVSGSRATPIPTDAVAGFPSASTLLRGARSIDEARSLSTKRLELSPRHEGQSSGKVTTRPKELGGEKEKVSAFKKPRGLREDCSETVQEKSTHAAAVQSATSVDNADILVPKKTRKKKNKDESEVQTTIKKTRITKPGTMKSCKKAVGSTKKAKEVVSAPMRPPASTQEEDLRAKEEFRDLCQEKAIPRRKEWTPCKDTAPDLTLSEDFEKPLDSELHVDTNLAKEPLIARFGNLLGDFGFSQKDDSPGVICGTTRQVNGEAMVKKRKIELVSGVPVPRVSEKPKRCKSPKKKPQTVTEKATAPFAPVKAVDAPSLLQYFGAPTTAESVIPARGAACNLDMSLTARRRSPVKSNATSKPAKTKAKKSVQKQPIIFSPESAMKNVRNQELIFGTSSQLAREESPTFIKNIQQAMKESESMVEPKQPRAKDYEFLDLPSGRSRSFHVQAIKASRSLWSAASRDINGSLVEVEMLDLADTPKPFCIVAESASVTKASGASELQLLSNVEVEQSHESQDVSDVPELGLDTPPALRQQLQELESVMPRSVAEAALRNRPKRKSPIKKTSAGKSEMNQMPNYEGFTDVQLKKEVSLNGFKPIKNRKATIVLLKQCWESKKSIALQEVPPNVSFPQPAKENINADITEQSSPLKKRGRPPKVPKPITINGAKDDNAPPKKPPGRPKKDPHATTSPKRKAKAKPALSEAIVPPAEDEIYDSTPPTPSLPRRRSPPKSPDLPLTLPLGTTTTISSTAVKNKDRAHLFLQITRAVTAFPPSHDPKRLTWYEKMLMYDPIVLEDLTIWLNTEGLGKVGEDDEVWPGLVKEWCEERSVCCLWRENLRGGARGRW